jgi:tRNA-dihydrouridine synthase B
VICLTVLPTLRKGNNTLLIPVGKVDVTNFPPAPASELSSPRSLLVGGTPVQNRVLPAPMCNISDRAYRGLCRRFGSHVVTTQMISSEGLVRQDARTHEMLDIGGEEPPVSVQMLGSDPNTLAEAARIIQDRGAALIDLNMGCPARKVTGNDCGSALMKNPHRVAEIVRKVSRAVTVPFTVKMRAGYDDGEFLAPEMARICEAEGAQAVALHARTRQQGYKGRADWNLIAEMKASVRIPVIGNGDVTSPRAAVAMMRQTGCDAVMVGRGIIGNPWLLRAAERAVQDFLAGRITHEDQVPGEEIVMVEDEDANTRARPIPMPYYMKDVPVSERLDLILHHTRLMVESKGHRRGVLEMRKHSQQYVKGIPGCVRLRERLMKIETVDDIETLIAEYRGYLASWK